MAFRLPTQVTVAPGCFRNIADTVLSRDCARVMLVLDEGLRATPWPDQAIALLHAVGLAVHVRDEVEPNPRYQTIDDMAAFGRDEEIDFVIGLGGGSVLDAAKAVSMLLRNSGSCLEYEGKNRFTEGTVPFVAIPTTCGTGSEVTWVSVISHVAQQRKLSVKGDAMFPDVALVDADLLRTLPAHLVAYTGIDALTHAIEAYTVTLRNPVSDALAEKAIVLLFAYLQRLVEDIEDTEARLAVMRASTLAGMAFGNADVGGVHCLSETLGGMWDVPHGLANAMLLTPVMRYHASVVAPRLASLYALIAPGAGTLSVAEGAGAFLQAVDALVASVHIPAFSSLAIPTDAYPQIAAGAVANNSNGSNPQPMATEDYLRILRQIDTRG